MTLQELYRKIGEDYEQALRVLRMEKLVDKHIRKFSHNEQIEAMVAAGEAMDAAQLFETAHAAKGICGNLGLTRLSAMASDIAEEFRPGHPRQMSDDAVREKLKEIDLLYRKTATEIIRYEEAI